MSSYLGGSQQVEYQTRQSELIVYGTVVGVDPGRWNSPSGKHWTSAKDEDVPAIYRAFYVEPIRVLKGQPDYGVPVAFMVLGGTEGVVDGPVKKGDCVLVFGTYDQSIYGNVQWNKSAYWARLMEYSIFLERNGKLVNVAEPDSQKFGTTDMGQVEAALSTN